MAKQTFTSGQVLTAAQMTSLQQTAMLGGDASAKTSSYTLVAADAGTAISMSNAGATTITVNTGLFAAGDIVTIVNLGAGVCTITAGTATVATSGSLALAQNQGGVLRFTSASAAIFFQFATPASGDIEGVTAGTGISGGGTSGTVTITNSMATAIDAKGDLVAGTGADTFARLAVGADGTTLVADSSQSTGLKWASSSPALVGVSAQATSQTLSVTANTQATLPLNSEDFDTDGFHDNATNNSRITIPTGKGGKYLLLAQIQNASTGNYGYLLFMKNGSNSGMSEGTPGAFLGRIQNNGGNTYGIQGSTVVTLAAGDYIQLGYQSDQTETMTYNARYTAIYLGA